MLAKTDLCPTFEFLETRLLLATNLLANGTFESNSLSGWTYDNAANAVVINTNVHTGVYAARISNTDLRTTVATVVGKEYKYTGWVKILSENVSDWGGFRLEVQDNNWASIANSGTLSVSGYGSDWFKVSLSFTAKSTTTRIRCGYFGGSGVVMADDLMVFDKSGANIPPQITATLTPSAVGNVPRTQQYTISGDDTDGAITHVEWDFGDGSRSLDLSGTRQVGVPGSYVATVRVTDDTGAMTTKTIPWTATGPDYPALTVASPAGNDWTVSTPTMPISGTASATGFTISSVKVSSDRGALVSATGTTAWNVAVPLMPGWNHLTVQVLGSNGKTMTAERNVHYVPSAPLGVSNIHENLASVERWNTIESTFSVDNTAATNPEFPYDPSPAPGLEWVDGASVDGVFWNTANPGVTYRRPAFLNQSYQRALKNNAEWMNPLGSPVWTLRFAPPSTGTWKYRIEVTEAKGSAQSAERTFAAVAPTSANNHGPVQLAPLDTRYFQFADGTPFLGNGTNIGFDANRYSYDAIDDFNQIGSGNEQLFRWWISGDVWGSAWSAWNAKSLDYDGYIPPNGLSLDRAYDDGLASAKLYPGEWLRYTVNVPAGGTYHLDSRVASADGGRFHYEIDGVKVGGDASVPDTGGMQTWQTISSSNFTLTAGQHTLRVVMDTDKYNINWFSLAPSSGSAIRIEAENYDAGGDGVGYHDTSAGNSGGVYKTDGVDIQATTDTGGGYNVTGIDMGNPILFQGFMSGHAAVENGHTYKLHVRWRTEGVTGPSQTGKPYGVAIRFTGWPDAGRTDTQPLVISQVNGNTPWIVSEGTFVADGNFIGKNSTGANYVSVILENSLGGAAYIDEITAQEVMPDGSLGPNVILDPKMNQQLTFDQRASAGIDAILAEAEARGMYFKMTISEKNEYLVNHLAADGLPDRNGGNFNNGPGTPTHRLDEYYWRYLFARFGASRAIQSWELVNEEAPGPGAHFRLTTDLANAAKADGNPHLATTSTWAGLAETAWKDPASAPISYADFHAYIRSTGWNEPKDTLAKDSALAFSEYDKDALAANFGKPVIWGEMGIDGYNGSDGQDPDLARDTQGVWLHKMIWARSGPGGVIPLYWYTDNIYNNDLHDIYGSWNKFMSGVQLTNGLFRDAAAGSTNANIRIFGQKDTTNGQAHLWIDNKIQTWRNVVDGVTITPQSGTVTVNMGRANQQYTVTWYNTWTGLPTSSQSLTANSSGVLSLSVANLASDLAVKIQLPIPTVELTATDASAAEPGTNTGSFLVTRSGAPTTGPLNVQYTIGGSATNGADYTLLTGTVTIPAGASSVPIPLLPKDDAMPEGNESVILTLAANAAYTIGARSAATVTIADNDYRIEAENLTLSTYRVESFSVASNGKLISLAGGVANEAGAGVTSFTGPAGWYDIKVGYFDENDGVGHLAVTVGGVVLDSWDLNLSRPDNTATVNTFVLRPVGTQVYLSPGTTISVAGQENLGESTRVDYLDLVGTTAPPPPTVLAATVNGGSANRSSINSLSLRFSRSVAASLTAGDLVLRDAGGQLVNTAAATMSYDAASNTATWQLAGLVVGQGNYTASLAGGSVSDAGGGLLDGNGDGVGGDAYTSGFHRLSGDANGDRLVDVGDLGMLGASYGQTGANLAGDMNNDNKVDVGDLGILGANYGTSLPAGSLDAPLLAGSLDAPLAGETLIAPLASRSAPAPSAEPLTAWQPKTTATALPAPATSAPAAWLAPAVRVASLAVSTPDAPSSALSVWLTSPALSDSTMVDALSLLELPVRLAV